MDGPMSITATRLREAVDKLSVHLAEGGAMPDGAPMSCYSCPVAVYLTQEMGKWVGTNGLVAYMIGDPLIRVPLHGNIRRWVDDFDTRN